MAKNKRNDKKRIYKHEFALRIKGTRTGIR